MFPIILQELFHGNFWKINMSWIKIIYRDWKVWVLEVDIGKCLKVPSELKSDWGFLNHNKFLWVKTIQHFCSNQIKVFLKLSILQYQFSQVKEDFIYSIGIKFFLKSLHSLCKKNCTIVLVFDFWNLKKEVHINWSN